MRYYCHSFVQAVLSARNALVPIPPVPPRSSRPISNITSSPNHSPSLPPLNSSDPLFVGCFSKYFDFFMTFLWVFHSCPKWTLCPLVLFISCFILWPSQKDKQWGYAFDSLKLLLKTSIGGANFFPVVPISYSTCMEPLIWVNMYFFIYVN